MMKFETRQSLPALNREIAHDALQADLLPKVEFKHSSRKSQPCLHERDRLT